MLIDSTRADRRGKPDPRSNSGKRADRPRPAAPLLPDRRQGPDHRATALRVLSAFLTAGVEPLEGRTPVPAPPRQPAGGVDFPRKGPASAPAVAASQPPPVPFPTLPPAAAGYARPSAMDVIERFVETARAGGLAAWRRRRG